MYKVIATTSDPIEDFFVFYTDDLNSVDMLEDYDWNTEIEYIQNYNDIPEYAIIVGSGL